MEHSWEDEYMKYNLVSTTRDWVCVQCRHVTSDIFRKCQTCGHSRPKIRVRPVDSKTELGELKHIEPPRKEDRPHAPWATIKAPTLARVSMGILKIERISFYGRIKSKFINELIPPRDIAKDLSRELCIKQLSPCLLHERLEAFKKQLRYPHRRGLQRVGIVYYEAKQSDVERFRKYGMGLSQICATVLPWSRPYIMQEPYTSNSAYNQGIYISDCDWRDSSRVTFLCLAILHAHEGMHRYIVEAIGIIYCRVI
eukprot:TRINITY_DN16642_c0_g1_i1.p1 TRINITY_DN16642_c0_g1~~TRINITY_DN16642_c0_g1_i1.p1  ORF type:complete len:254 (-),score=21.56 TRINITY_DN16642_c0_g1_i1:256-1017(-)